MLTDPQFVEAMGLPPQRFDPILLPGGIIFDTEKSLLMRSVELIAEQEQDNNPCFVEVGSWYGATAEAVARVLRVLGCRSSFRTIDPNPRGEAFWRLRGMEPVEATGIKGKAHEVADRLSKAIAWCYIDACHCYNCASRDIAAFAPRISPGGVLAFHDVHLDDGRSQFCCDHKTCEVVYAIRNSAIITERFTRVAYLPPQGTNGGVAIYRRRAADDV
jgi:hypothetical protein